MRSFGCDGMGPGFQMMSLAVEGRRCVARCLLVSVHESSARTARCGSIRRSSLRSLYPISSHSVRCDFPHRGTPTTPSRSLTLPLPRLSPSSSISDCMYRTDGAGNCRCQDGRSLETGEDDRTSRFPNPYIVPDRSCWRPPPLPGKCLHL